MRKVRWNGTVTNFEAELERDADGDVHLENIEDEDLEDDQEPEMKDGKKESVSLGLDGVEEIWSSTSKKRKLGESLDSESDKDDDESKFLSSHTKCCDEDYRIIYLHP